MAEEENLQEEPARDVEDYHDGDLEKALEESELVEESLELDPLGVELEEPLPEVLEEALAEDLGDEALEKLEQIEESLADGLAEVDVLAEGAEDALDSAGDEMEEVVLDDELSEDEEDEEDDEGVQDHLKEAVEGTLRLKRLLSEDEEVPEELIGKRRRTKKEEATSAADEARIQQLLTRWGLAQEPVTRHVLESLTPEELKLLGDTFAPNKFDLKRQPAELVLCHVALMKERAGPGSGNVDNIAAFRHRWKLSMEQEAKLRQLSHKELRYVTKEYDGETPLEEVLEQAAAFEANEGLTEGALPKEPGLHVMSRFNRLELIDPVAVAAIFGDANLSFALKLARHREALGHVGRVIATTFETLPCLRERYKEIDETIKTLEGYYTEVYHGVDCTRIAVDNRFQGMEGSLGAVYYNFPHAGAVSGFFDGHPCVNWRHENLMRLFFRALRSFMKPGGIVKVSSSKGAVGVRFFYIIDSAKENEFVHVETFPFQEWHLHRYGRSYGDKRDVTRRPGEGENYNQQKAEADMVYTFRYEPSGNSLPPQSIRMPPKFGVLKATADGPFRSLIGEARQRHAMALYKRFVTECSGTHVG